MLFEPKQGISQVELTFQALADMPTGAIVPHSELPFPNVAQAHVRKVMEREQGRSLMTVRGEGWKIIAGAEQVSVAARDRRRSIRAAGRGLHSIQTVDRRELSAEEQLRADQELIRAQTGYARLRSVASQRLGIEQVTEWRRQNGRAA